MPQICPKYQPSLERKSSESTGKERHNLLIKMTYGTYQTISSHLFKSWPLYHLQPPINVTNTTPSSLDLRPSTQASETPSLVQHESKEHLILGDKAVGGMDDGAAHVGNTRRGLEAAITNPKTSEMARREAVNKLRVLESTA